MGVPDCRINRLLGAGLRMAYKSIPQSTQALFGRKQVRPGCVTSLQTNLIQQSRRQAPEIWYVPFSPYGREAAISVRASLVADAASGA